MTRPPVALPPELHACINSFLAQANEMHKLYRPDAISASILYAAARYNVHGFVQQGDAGHFTREQFIAYMSDLYQRMLNEQLDVMIAANSGPSANSEPSE